MGTLGETAPAAAGGAAAAAPPESGEPEEVVPPEVRGRLARWSSPPGLSGLMTISAEVRLPLLEGGWVGG